MIVVCVRQEILETQSKREKKNLRAFKDNNCHNAIIASQQFFFMFNIALCLATDDCRRPFVMVSRSNLEIEPYVKHLLESRSDATVMRWLILDARHWPASLQIFFVPRRSERSIKVAISRVLIRALKNLWSPTRGVPTSDHLGSSAFFVGNHRYLTFIMHLN